MWNTLVMYLFEALFQHFFFKGLRKMVTNINQGSWVPGSELNMQLSKKKVVLNRQPQHPWGNLFLLGNSFPHCIVFQLRDCLFVPWFSELFTNISARIYVIHMLCHVTHFYISMWQTAFCCTKIVVILITVFFSCSVTCAILKKKTLMKL